MQIVSHLFNTQSDMEDCTPLTVFQIGIRNVPAIYSFSSGTTLKGSKHLDVQDD